MLSLNSVVFKGMKITDNVTEFKESTTEKFTKVHKSKNKTRKNNGGKSLV